MKETTTKRNDLRAIATLFDPLQSLSSFTLRGKVLMQQIWLWVAGVDWNEALPADLEAKWKTWVNELSVLTKFKIPRSLRHAEPRDKQLHLFSDASKVVYAAVAYLVCLYEHGPPTSCL